MCSSDLLVETAPFRESGYRYLIHVLARQGNVAEALIVYERLRTLLREELGASPSAQTQALHRRLLEGAGAAPAAPGARILATVLFTDIVSSTERAVEAGDRGWRELVARHHALVREELERSGGKEVDTAGDGFFTTFETPGEAIACASAVVVRVRDLGIEIRAGIHTGEVEVSENHVGGIAVHIGARIASSARPSEVLVSGTVKDLVAGSGIEFEDRGLQALRGVPGEWRLFAVAQTSVSALAGR